ncbi:MAG: metallophosphoesterase family protein [Desulfovibrio sp.]
MSLYLVFSDLHANLEALQCIHGYYKELQPDKVLFLGDVVGYGPSPCECVDFMRDWEGLVSLQGNHDFCAAGNFGDLEGYSRRAMSSLLWSNQQLDEEQQLWLRNRPNIFREKASGFAHSSWRKPQTFPYYRSTWQVIPAMWGVDIETLFVGHMHTERVWTVKNGIFVKDSFPEQGVPLALDSSGKNVVQLGAAGFLPESTPKRSLTANVMLYDSDADTIEYRSLDYDWETAMKKIEEMKLSVEEDEGYQEIEIPRII